MKEEKRNKEIETFSIKAEGIDVKKVMRKIRENISKHKLDLLTQDQLDELTETSFVFPPLPGEIGDELADKFDSADGIWNLNIEEIFQEFSTESGDWNLNPKYKIKSHRKLSGFFIIMIKKLIQPFVRLYTDYIVYRQAKINHEFFNLIKEQGRINNYIGFINHNLIKELTKTKLQADSLEYSINQLKSEIEFLKKREKALEKLIRHEN
ncbi:hypothetical protein KKB18_11205 [bacterium]|nr:hypothetical protein [bacterium]